jgi:hypothetical protein
LGASPPKKGGMSVRIIFCFVWQRPTKTKNNSHTQKVLLAAAGGDNNV